MIADGNGVIALVQASGERDGKTNSWGYAHVWEIKEHKATSFIEYSDDGEAQIALFA